MDETKKPERQEYAEHAILQGIDERILKAAEKALDISFDPSYWALTELGVSLYDNQIEILESVIDPKIRYVTIIGARSSGKTYAVGAGVVKICIDLPGVEIGVFAPKASQSIRVLEEIATKILNKTTREKYLDEERTTKSSIYFKNGSHILAQSAAVETQGEGWHFDILVVDESQFVADLAFSQRLVPMVSSSRIAKIIQLGVPLYKNHFWSSFVNSQYTKHKYSWLDCPKLYESGTIKVDGRFYPKFMVDQMPYDLKQKIFPDHPDLWYESVTKMSTEDFRTQYIMDWLDDINLVLTEEDQKKLVTGMHNHLSAEHSGDVYYFGLDFAGGAIVGEKIQSDFTALSIWRKTLNLTKEKVFSIEWKGDLSNQLEEITSIIHPRTGLFKCRGGLADYGNMGAAMVDIMKKQGISIEGVFFAAREPQSGKNYKNAMYEHFLFELRNDRVRYPNVLNSSSRAGFESSDQSFKTIKKHFDQWCKIERRRSATGLNDKISVPDGEGHDDGPSSDVLALWAADKSGDGSIGWMDYKFPNASVPKSLSLMGRMSQQFPQVPGMPGIKHRQ